MTGDTRIRILTVDDHPLLRQGVAGLIATQRDMVLVAEAANGREAIAQFERTLPDVTLMDLQLPELGGIEALVDIRSRHPQARIVVLTTYQGDAQAVRALKAGARAFLLKGSLRTELLSTIRAVHAGQRCVTPEIAKQLVDYIDADTLTEREIDVLRLVAEGNSNKQIAEALSIAEETVKGRLRSILGKLGANDRTHAVTIALRRGIIPL